jgi:hypothetical protein
LFKRGDELVEDEALDSNISTRDETELLEVMDALEGDMRPLGVK